MPGKSKINLEYIEDKKKRTNILYKRRRGLVKKAHELSVICGVKISIVCTDFDKTCFTFCNDDRLRMDLSTVLEDLKGDIWLTKFEPADYPFDSIKTADKHKIHLEQQQGESSASHHTHEDSSDQLSNSLSSFLEKRAENSSDSPKASSKQKSLKKLKIKHIEKKDANWYYRRDFGTLGHLADLRMERTNVDKFLTEKNLEANLSFNLKAIIHEVKSDSSLKAKLRAVDKHYFTKLEKVSELLIKQVSKEMNFLDKILLRNLFCLYLITLKRFSSQEISPPPKNNSTPLQSRFLFKNLHSLPIATFLDVITKVDALNINAVNEAFLRLLFSKNSQLQMNQPFFDQIQKIGETGAYHKLNSFKKVYAKHLVMCRYYCLDKLKKLALIGKKPNKTDFPNPELLLKEFKARNLTQIVALYDKTLIITLHKMLTFNLILDISIEFVQNLPKEDFRMGSELLLQDPYGKLPIMANILGHLKGDDQKAGATNLSKYVEQSLRGVKGGEGDEKLGKKDESGGDVYGDGLSFLQRQTPNRKSSIDEISSIGWIDGIPGEIFTPASRKSSLGLGSLFEF